MARRRGRTIAQGQRRHRRRLGVPLRCSATGWRSRAPPGGRRQHGDAGPEQYRLHPPGDGPEQTARENSKDRHATPARALTAEGEGHGSGCAQRRTHHQPDEGVEQGSQAFSRPRLHERHPVADHRGQDQTTDQAAQDRGHHRSNRLELR
ncbi:hypothetical protein A7K94_0201845 [Modestobacter sp. VKM Ac-2676]|nr:hypothetical protein A7K94_0201845 [Modestobacter sp. VKM Ac-2676]